jgi:phosphosulfolactate phosphohydrolase-like enzyme
MNQFVADVTHNSKEDANKARSYLTQVEESLENLIKAWNILKQLPVTNAKRDEVFAKEEDVKKVVMDGRIAALSFISNVDPESSIDNRSLVPRAPDI